LVWLIALVHCFVDKDARRITAGKKDLLVGGSGGYGGDW
jgi:hypothetical protein